MALDAGSAVARLSAIFEDRGFRAWDRAKDETEREAKKPVNVQLGADVEQKGFRGFTGELAKARADAKRGATAKLDAKADTSQITRWTRAIQDARAKSKTPIVQRMEARVDTSSVAGAQKRLGIFDRAISRVRAKAKTPIVQRMVARVDTSSIGGAEKRLGGFDAALRSARAKARVPITPKVDMKQPRDELGRFVATGRRTDGTVNKLNSSFQLLRNGMRLLKWPLIATGAGIATQALSAATAGAAGLLGALGPLSGAFAAIPAFAGAAAQGMSVWKLATGGVKEALGGLNEKLAETDAAKAAFKNLSKEGQQFARELEKMKPIVRDLQNIAQRGLFPGLREGISEASKNLPVVKRLIDQTAKALGGMAAKAGKALGSAEWGRDIETIGSRNVRIMTKLGDAAGNVANALRHVAVASGPAMEGLAQDVVGLTEKLERAAAAGRKSGRLGAFFDRARERAHKVSRILGNVAGGLVRILSLGNKHMGGPLLNDLEKVSKRFNEWTKSAKGQNSIRDYFKRARPAVSELGRTISAAGKAFLRMGSAPGLAKTIATIRTRLIPALERMLTTMANVAGPAVVSALASLADLFAAIAPHVGFVMRIVAKLVGGLADLIRTAPGVGAVVAVMLALGGAVKAIKFVSMITGLTTVLKLLRAVRAAGGVGAAIRTALGGAGASAGAAGGAAGGKWSAGFRGALARAGLVGAAAAAFTTLVPMALREGKKAAAAFKQNGLKGWAAHIVASNRKVFSSLGLIAPSAKKAGDAMRQAHERAAAAARRNVIEEINLQRKVSGLPPMLGRSRTAVAKFAQAYGRIPAVRRFLLKTNSPQVVAKVAHLGNKLKAMGKARTVARIIGNAKNARDAANRLERLYKRVTKQRYEAKLRADSRAARRTGSSVAKWLDRNFGKRFTAKLGANDRGARTVIGRAINSIRDKFVRPTFKAVLGGDPRNAQSVVKGAATLIGNKFVGPKWTAMLGADKKKFDPIHRRAVKDLKDLHNQKPKPKIDADAARAKSVISGIRSALRSIPDETVNINVKKRRRGESGGFMGAFAAGGVADMAHGGPVPGAPLGTPAADGRGNADVAPGEAVLTGHQQGHVENAMAYAKAMGAGAFGSLAEMFSKVTTRHSVPAGGGRAGAFHSGGGSHIAEDGSRVNANFYDRPAGGSGGSGRSGSFASWASGIARAFGGSGGGGSGGGGGRMIRAEDGSMVPASFYDRPAFATGGKVDPDGMPVGWQTATGNTANPYVATSTYRPSRREERVYAGKQRIYRRDHLAYSGKGARGLADWSRQARRFGRWTGIYGGDGRPNVEHQEDPQGIDRELSMWGQRYDLTEEEFVRDGALSKPDINRRMSEINHLIALQQRKMRYLSSSREEGKSAVYWLDRAGRFLKYALGVAPRGAPTDGLKEDREEYSGYAKSWRELLRNRPSELFEHKTSLMEMENERARLLPNAWPALLAAAGGGGGGDGGASSDDGRMQREIERLTRALQSAQGLSVFGGANDIGAGGRPGLLALRHGGVVPGTGPPDSRLALVSPGERWSTPQANEQFGGVYDALERAAGRAGLGGSRRGGGCEAPRMSFEPLQPLTDGRTLGLLSDAVTAGMGRQGHRTSTRERTGL